MLISGIFKCLDDVEYVSITTTTNGVIVPTKAINLNNRFYVYNVETGTMEEEDIVDDGLTIIQATTSNVIRFEKNQYVRKNNFDCTKEVDQQSSSYQPISGLTTDTTYQTIKTHNFDGAKDKPSHDDIVEYQHRFWFIEELGTTYIYTPREKSTLHLSLKAINK